MDSVGRMLAAVWKGLEDASPVPCKGFSGTQRHSGMPEPDRSQALQHQDLQATMWQATNLVGLVKMLRGMRMGSAPQVAQGSQGRGQLRHATRDGAVLHQDVHHTQVQRKLVRLVWLLSELWRRQAHSNTQQQQLLPHTRGRAMQHQLLPERLCAVHLERMD